MPTLAQEITYWAPGPEDRFGGKSYSSPIKVRGRWEDRTENVITPNGQTITSRSRVFVDRAIIATGFLAPGVFEGGNPLEIVEAQEIRVVGSVPNLSNLARLYTAYI